MSIDLDNKKVELKLIPGSDGGWGIRGKSLSGETYIRPVIIAGEKMYYNGRIGTVLHDKEKDTMVLAFVDNTGAVESKDDLGKSFGTAYRHISRPIQKRIQCLAGKKVTVTQEISLNKFDPSRGSIPKGDYSFVLEGGRIQLYTRVGNMYKDVPLEAFEGNTIVQNYS